MSWSWIYPVLATVGVRGNGAQELVQWLDSANLQQLQGPVVAPDAAARLGKPTPASQVATRWLADKKVPDAAALLAFSGGMPLAAAEMAEGGAAAARKRFVDDIVSVPRKAPTTPPTQRRKAVSNVFGSSKRKMRRNVSSEGIPFLSTKNRRSQASLARAQKAMSSTVSQSESIAAMAITCIS
mgnify:CR=1 FL=1